jgi:hypothetical protein
LEQIEGGITVAKHVYVLIDLGEAQSVESGLWPTIEQARKTFSGSMDISGDVVDVYEFDVCEEK